MTIDDAEVSFEIGEPIFDSCLTYFHNVKLKTNTFFLTYLFLVPTGRKLYLPQFNARAGHPPRPRDSRHMPRNPSSHCKQLSKLLEVLAIVSDDQPTCPPLRRSTSSTRLSVTEHPCSLLCLTARKSVMLTGKLQLAIPHQGPRRKAVSPIRAVLPSTSRSNQYPVTSRASLPHASQDRDLWPTTLVQLASLSRCTSANCLSWPWPRTQLRTPSLTSITISSVQAPSLRKCTCLTADKYPAAQSPSALTRVPTTLAFSNGV